MDKKLKAKWLKALRGGRYKQGDNQLRDNGSYCCLGVLATIQGCRWKDNVPHLGKVKMGPPDGEDIYLRPKFAGGLSSSTQRNLARMNDAGDSFKKIADYIEKRL